MLAFVGYWISGIVMKNMTSRREHEAEDTDDEGDDNEGEGEDE